MESLGYEICYTARKIYKFMTKAFESYDITPEQFILLNLLSEKEGVSQMDLALGLDKDKNTVKAMVDNLEKKDYLEKRENPSDKRAYSLYLTEKAKITIPQIKVYEDEYSKKIVSILSLEEKACIENILKKICKEISDSK